jgi:hypothetical protein
MPPTLRSVHAGVVCAQDDAMPAVPNGPQAIVSTSRSTSNDGSVEIQPGVPPAACPRRVRQ